MKSCVQYPQWNNNEYKVISQMCTIAWTPWIVFSGSSRWRMHNKNYNTEQQWLSNKDSSFFHDCTIHVQRFFTSIFKCAAIWTLALVVNTHSRLRRSAANWWERWFWNSEHWNTMQMCTIRECTELQLLRPTYLVLMDKFVCTCMPFHATQLLPALYNKNAPNGRTY